LYAEAFLAKSKEPKAKVEEARRVLGRVRELHALAVKASESTPADDKTGQLRKRLTPILQELYTLPYPPLLHPAGG